MRGQPHPFHPEAPGNAGRSASFDHGGPAGRLRIEASARLDSWYHPSMQKAGLDSGKKPRPLAALWRATIEVAFIVFLFYSNLLMGEFTVANGRGKTLGAALADIFTSTNFLIAVFSALIGYLVFEYLRKRNTAD
jgi:hypothetical protein